MIIKSRNAFVLVNAADIIRIESNGHSTFFYTTSETYESRTSIGELERVLNPQHFLRISRFHIVNMDHVKMIQHWFRGQYRFHLNDGTMLVATRRYRDRIRVVLENSSVKPQE